MDCQLIKNDICCRCLKNVDVVLFETELDNCCGSVNIDHMCICKKCFDEVLNTNKEE